MKPRSSPDKQLPRWLASLSPGLQIAWSFLSAEQQAAAFAEYRALVAETMKGPRKFALRAFREHHPREHLNDPDEALLIGVSEKTYRGMRDRDEL